MYRPTAFVPAALALLASLAAACQDQGPELTSGALLVTVATTGSDLDPDGYSLSVDGGTALPISVNGSLTVSALGAGSHSVLLSGNAPNCPISGANPRSVDAIAGETVQVGFAVSCTAITGLIIDGVWDWTERISSASVTCSDTGSYSFSQAGATFDGLSRQVGSCRTPGDNARTDPVHGGIVSGDDLRFTVGTGGTCNYTAQAAGTPPASLSGIVLCSDGSTGTWSAVRQQPVASVTVTAPTVTMLPGVMAQIVAQLADVQGNRVFFRPITWTSDQPGVATVVAMTYDSARVTAVASGSAAITASAGGKSGTASVVVNPLGHLRVTISTRGVDLDPNGYLVRVTQPFWWEEAVLTNGTVTHSWLAGDWTVQLDDVAANCVLTGQSPLTITVSPDDTTDVAFLVTCQPVTRLAYVSVNNGDPEIYSIASNGSDSVRLTFNPAHDVQPAWSPDGSRIAFASDRDGNFELYVMNSDGTNPVRLTTDSAYDGEPAWSPDGSKLAFVTARDGNREIYMMGVDGSNAVRLTNNLGNDGEPDWSPNGDKIAFTSNRDGSAGIFVMNTDGSNLVRLTDNPDWAPAWSPDGSRIAFNSSLDGNGTIGIFVMNADGSARAPVPGTTGGEAPAWSPDGARLAFTLTSICSDDWCSAIESVKPDGTGFVVVLGDFGRLFYQVAWRR